MKKNNDSRIRKYPLQNSETFFGKNAASTNKSSPNPVSWCRSGNSSTTHKERGRNHHHPKREEGRKQHHPRKGTKQPQPKGRWDAAFFGLCCLPLLFCGRCCFSFPPSSEECCFRSCPLAQTPLCRLQTRRSSHANRTDIDARRPIIGRVGRIPKKFRHVHLQQVPSHQSERDRHSQHERETGAEMAMPESRKACEKGLILKSRSPKNSVSKRLKPSSLLRNQGGAVTHTACEGKKELTICEPAQPGLPARAGQRSGLYSPKA